MAAIPQPPAITLDDLATIAAKIQPIIRSANPSSERTARRIEAIFRTYGIAFVDATTDGEQPCP